VSSETKRVESVGDGKLIN
jgi:hypothetical protein